MRVIGTAGHVDHGKSTLIQALTGTHPDRLKEEQEREMTIDLGFAWWQLPNGEDVGVVDVPGHRDFTENMLAGVGGIDGVLFVVAADEGVMPQTREHLAILDILQIQAGVVALTKTDLVQDESWLDLVQEDLRNTLQGTVLAQAPIIPVSARRGTGLEELQQALVEVLKKSPVRQDLGRPRLPIDRVFSISGFGTVVTGTLLDGSFKVGDELEILPGGLRGRVRGLQNHKLKVEIAHPSSRTAINISGLDTRDVDRGQVVSLPGTLEATRRLDVHFRLLPDASQPLVHDMQVKLFIGAAEVVARLRLLGEQELKPGMEGWLQLEPIEPVVALRGDRYILRRPSPGETLGGGVVLDPHPKRRHKRFSSAVLDRLDALAAGTPQEIFLQALAVVGIADYQSVVRQSNLTEEQAGEAFEDILNQNQVLLLAGNSDKPKEMMIANLNVWQATRDKALDTVRGYHEKQPLRLGMPREELKSRMKLAPNIYNLVVARLVIEGDLQEQGPLVLLPGHRVEFSVKQQQAVDALLRQFANAPFNPPKVKECQSAVGEDVYQAMLDLGELVQLDGEVVFRSSDYQQAVDDVRSLIKQYGSIELGQARDHWGTSRRYVQALLEYMDAKGITVRKGDVRELRK